jgi:putative hydrolase of the HAD superfamily
MMFDLDGTLLDHDTAEQAGIEGWLSDAGFPTSVEGVASDRIWRRIGESAFQDYFAGRTTFREQRRIRVRRFLPYMGVDITGMSDLELDVQFQEYGRRYHDALRPFPDALDCLTRLAHSHRLAVFTNGDKDKQDAKMRRHGLATLVETTIASSSIGDARPDPATFQAALQLLGAAPEDATYVGDRLDIDARAASAAGLTGVWINRKGDPTDPGGIRTITTLASLP